jgi:hypothetical protein
VATAAKAAGIGQASLATLAAALVRHPRGGWRCTGLPAPSGPRSRQAGNQPAVRPLGQGPSRKRRRRPAHRGASAAIGSPTSFHPDPRSGRAAQRLRVVRHPLASAI